MFSLSRRHEKRTDPIVHGRACGVFASGLDLVVDKRSVAPLESNEAIKRKFKPNPYQGFHPDSYFLDEGCSS